MASPKHVGILKQETLEQSKDNFTNIERLRIRYKGEGSRKTTQKTLIPFQYKDILLRQNKYYCDERLSESQNF